MDGANEDRAKKHPQQSRQPAPENGDRRSDDRTCSGNAGEVVTEDDLSLSRNEVHVIAKFMGRNDGVAVELKNFLRQPSPIRVVRNDVSEKGKNGHSQC